ncbi:MAG: phosphotransferase [Acholeplasmatales bacterium]|jgi:thiamine kinase-like enzyme|nr:phosphotransferase [Acholeplasmatales bacterium]
MNRITVKKQIMDILSVKENEIEDITVLLSGMSNAVYKVKYSGNTSVIRIPLKESHLFVDWKIEEEALNFIKDEDITPKYYVFNYQSGMKVLPFIDGVDLSCIDYEPHLPQIVEILKKIHNKKGFFPYCFNFVANLKKFENLLPQIDPTYFELKSIWFDHYENEFRDKNIVMCHCDAQRSNFILSDEGKLYIIDFEFSAANSVYYDLASFGNNGIEDAEALTKEYFKDTTEDIDLCIRKVKYYRMYQVLQWYLVASAKHNMKMDRTLKMDFEKIALDYLEAATSLCADLEL